MTIFRRHLPLRGTTWASRGSSEPAAAPVRFSDERQSTYRFDNLGGTLEPGEPTVGGRMHATGWAHIKWPLAARLVIQTFGSDIDTVLAGYTGSGIPNLHLITASDDRVVPGASAKQSLIKLQVAKNTLYHIQFGGKTNATGDITPERLRAPADRRSLRLPDTRERRPRPDWRLCLLSGASFLSLREAEICSL